MRVRHRRRVPGDGVPLPPAVQGVSREASVPEGEAGRTGVSESPGQGHHAAIIRCPIAAPVHQYLCRIDLGEPGVPAELESATGADLILFEAGNVTEVIIIDGPQEWTAL